MKGPSSHLSWKELACHDGTPYPFEWRQTRAVELARLFEIIRSRCGHVPIVVNSAFRTPEYNRKIGGARNSQHVQGRALDLRPPAGWTTDRFYRLIRALADELFVHGEDLIGGIGQYPNFVHVDTRPTKRLAVWSGNSPAGG